MITPAILAVAVVVFVRPWLRPVWPLLGWLIVRGCLRVGILERMLSPLAERP